MCMHGSVLQHMIGDWQGKIFRTSIMLFPGVAKTLQHTHVYHLTGQIILKLKVLPVISQFRFGPNQAVVFLWFQFKRSVVTGVNVNVKRLPAWPGGNNH